ncbi:MAG: hypothetical protein EBY37_04950 [Flavobacteriia bacterium]|nr:hypothetical protein [Flavobacteriia bacterium]
MALLVQAQNNERFQKFKTMKRDFIIENTKLNETEKATFYDLFDKYENRYHNEVWLLKRKVRQEVSNAFDTISSESASKYINEYFQFEQLGMTIKHERNQKLLKLIRPKEVLRILHQEKEFDQVMLNRMRNRHKKEQEKGKEKE